MSALKHMSNSGLVVQRASLEKVINQYKQKAFAVDNEMAKRKEEKGLGTQSNMSFAWMRTNPKLAVESIISFVDSHSNVTADNQTNAMGWPMLVLHGVEVVPVRHKEEEDE